MQERCRREKSTRLYRTEKCKEKGRVINLYNSATSVWFYIFLNLFVIACIFNMHTEALNLKSKLLQHQGHNITKISALPIWRDQVHSDITWGTWKRVCFPPTRMHLYVLQRQLQCSFTSEMNAGQLLIVLLLSMALSWEAREKSYFMD